MSDLGTSARLHRLCPRRGGAGLRRRRARHSMWCRSTRASDLRSRTGRWPSSSGP